MPEELRRRSGRGRARVSCVLAGCVAACSLGAAARAAEWTVTREAVVSAGDTGPFDMFGFSVALGTDTALIGSCNADHEPVSGKAYVFRRSGGEWKQVQKLTPEQGWGLMTFGSVAALEGEVGAVGAPGRIYLPMEQMVDEPAHKGAVYVYARSGGRWVEEARLEAADGHRVDGFGAAIVISGGVIAVGAPGRWDDETKNVGGVYLFERAGGKWVQSAKLAPERLEEGEEFGMALALNGDTLLAGSEKGIRVFTRSKGTWDSQGWLKCDAGAYWEILPVPNQIALEGGDLLVPAPHLETRGPDTASPKGAWVYRRTAGIWKHVAELTPVVSAGKKAGAALCVALSGDVAAVADGDCEIGLRLFARSGGKWAQAGRIRSADLPGGGDFMPCSFDLHGDTVAVGGVTALNEMEFSVVIFFRLER